MSMESPNLDAVTTVSELLNNDQIDPLTKAVIAELDRTRPSEKKSA